MRICELFESSIEIDGDNEETEDLIELLQRSRWKILVKNSIIKIFGQMYPEVKVSVKNTQDGWLEVSTGSGYYQNNPDNEFVATIFGPDAHIGIDGKRYAGLGFESVEAGKYKGVVSKLLAEIVPIIAKKINASPAIVIVMNDESGGAWQNMASKLGWPYIDETNT
jgi:hypothetical protein